MSPSMLWHVMSENKKAGKSARSILLHPVQRCYKFPIPLHPSSSNLIPFISQTPYIYLTGFQVVARDCTAEWFGDGCWISCILKHSGRTTEGRLKSRKTVFRRPERCCGSWRRACFDSMGERWPVQPEAVCRVPNAARLFQTSVLSKTSSISSPNLSILASPRP